MYIPFEAVFGLTQLFKSAIDAIPAADRDEVFMKDLRENFFMGAVFINRKVCIFFCLQSAVGQSHSFFLMIFLYCT
jgi:hypothetical protein